MRVGAPPLELRVADARPAMDRFVAEVMASNTAAALFGVARPVKVGRYHLRRVLGSGGGGAVFVGFDPELDRELAIKLIVADTDGQRARALAEGQALARLTHPHVVAVHDVGVVDDRVYLAMELVVGEPLRRYATTASPRAVLRAYRQAGDGLAAAHAAGLVHGDFKPDNAVVGGDGRVRVVDFGLAGAVGADVGGGTPAYMAPECAAGAAAAPAIDQYAFAVSLRESLGVAGWAKLPRWLAPVLTRGAAVDPGARYPELAAMLAALDADPRRRRRLYAVPVTLILGGALFTAGPRRPVSGPRCDDAIAALAPAWSTARRDGIVAHLRGLDTAFATTTAATAPAALERYALAWGQAHTVACIASERELPAVAARRATCLARARDRLGAIAELFETTDAASVADAVRAASELPAVERCAAADVDLDEIEPPSSALTAQVAAVASELERASARVDAARPDAVDTTAAVVARARALGYRPLVATALLWHGRAQAEAGAGADARATLLDAVDLAIAARADGLAVEAFARTLLVAADDYAGAVGGLRPIAALADRLGRRDRFATALLHNHAGVLERAAGHVDAARAEWIRALALARDIDGPGAVELAWVRTNLALVTVDRDAQLALHAEALALARGRLGPDHPLTLDLAMAAGFSAPTAELARAGLRGPCTRAASLHPSRGAVALDCAYELAILDLAVGAWADADASLALATSPTLGGALDPDRLAIARAFAAYLARDSSAAGQFTALAARLAPGPTTPWFALLPAADVELGRALTGDAAAPARAVALLERAAEVEPGPLVARRLTWARDLAGR